MSRPVRVDEWRAFLQRSQCVNVGITIERRRLLILLTRAVLLGGDHFVSIEVIDKMRTFLSLPNIAIQADAQGPLGIYSFIRLVSSELTSLEDMALPVVQ